MYPYEIAYIWFDEQQVQLIQSVILQPIWVSVSPGFTHIEFPFQPGTIIPVFV